MTSTYLEPEEMEDFVKHHVQQQSGFNNVDRDEAFANLTQIWLELGFDRWNVEQRIKTANGHISQLYMQMQIEEREVLDSMKADLAAALTTIRELTSELGLPPYRYEGPPQLVVKFDHVTAEQKELEKRKETAMIELHRLKNIEERLCEQLDHVSIKVSLKVVPKVADLEQIKQNIHVMEKLVQTRLEKFRKLKFAITSAFDLLGETPKDEWTIRILEADEDPFVVLKENVNHTLETKRKNIEARRDQKQKYKNELEEKLVRLSKRLEKPSSYINQFTRHDLSNSWLEQLREELESLEAEKKSKLKELVESCRVDIAKLWEKMYFSQKQREAFHRYYSENYNEELLDDHERILKKLEEEYSQHANMFKGVDQWNGFFETYRVMDAEDKDPNRFKNNRGGALLKKQKEFKRVKVQLTQLENNLKADITEWEKDNEKEFQVDGVGFKKYIETQWAAVCESKDMERRYRNQKKKVDLAREMTFGTTPTKRGNFGSTLSLADTKRSRIDITAQSKFSRIPNIPPFRRPFAAPSRPGKEEEAPKESRLTKKSRRRSKSASNLLKPYGKVLSKVSARINTFRTPQPLKASSSRIPLAHRGVKTELKPSRKLFSEKMEDDNDDRICQPILEDKENDSNGTFEFESAENLAFGGPTSLKSAPQFDTDGPPLSYEEFGDNLGSRRHVRSSAYGFHEI